MNVHRIRLKGPWDYEWLQGAPINDAPASGRIHMPSDWQEAFGNASGVVKFTRHFQRPTNLDVDERVFLVFEGIGGAGEISLNGERLTRSTESVWESAVDVTAQLQLRNQIVACLDFDPQGTPDIPGGLWKSVVIEIRRL